MSSDDFTICLSCDLFTYWHYCGDWLYLCHQRYNYRSVICRLLSGTYGRLMIRFLRFPSFQHRYNLPLPQAAYFTLLNETEETHESRVSIDKSHIRGDVTFEHVKFGYEDDKTLMNDVSFTAKSGQMVRL